MAPHEYGNYYGMSVNVVGIGGSAAYAGVCNSGGDIDVAAQAHVVCDMATGSEHWAVDDVCLASAGDAGLFLAVFAWGGVA